MKLCWDITSPVLNKLSMTACAPPRQSGVYGRRLYVCQNRNVCALLPFTKQSADPVLYQEAQAWSLPPSCHAALTEMVSSVCSCFCPLGSLWFSSPLGKSFPQAPSVRGSFSWVPSTFHIYQLLSTYPPPPSCCELLTGRFLP